MSQEGKGVLMGGTGSSGQGNSSFEPSPYAQPYAVEG